ncbi:MAG: EFR1 family ferrodoxin [Lachnospiraceae bacterium]|nr:EFR1 family ferrodoxin [Lachnospiraceae bacterium]MBR1876797.1 EFR1 family ferrodoxin [Lachnospiraceae bacterium]
MSNIIKDFFNPKKKIKMPGMSENFYATEDCDGCGICADKCPSGHIKMINGRPDWGKPCLMCAMCGSVCPKGAISYGIKTQDKKD